MRKRNVMQEEKFAKEEWTTEDDFTIIKEWKRQTYLQCYRGC